MNKQEWAKWKTRIRENHFPELYKPFNNFALEKHNTTLNPKPVYMKFNISIHEALWFLIDLKRLGIRLEAFLK